MANFMHFYTSTLNFLILLPILRPLNSINGRNDKANVDHSHRRRADRGGGHAEAGRGEDDLRQGGGTP